MKAILCFGLGPVTALYKSLSVDNRQLSNRCVIKYHSNTNFSNNEPDPLLISDKNAVGLVCSWFAGIL